MLSRSRLSLLALLTVSILGACVMPTETMMECDPEITEDCHPINPPSDDPPTAAPIGYQLTKVNGVNVYPWNPSAVYKFRADASDSVDTKYTVRGGYMCVYPATGTWGWVRVIQAEWDTWNSDGIHYPVGGDFHGSGVIYNFYGTVMAGTELRLDGDHAFSATMLGGSGAVTVVINGEGMPAYQFVNAGTIGSQNCALALTNKRKLSSLIRR